MQISDVRQALADAVKAYIPSGIRTYAYVPDAVSPPLFYAGEVSLDPNLRFGGADKATITCRIFTSAANDRTGQKLLDQFLSQTGAYSIRTALQNARGGPGNLSLSNTCADLNVTAIRGYRLYTIGDNQYYGAEIDVMVIGT